MVILACPLPVHFATFPIDGLGLATLTGHERADTREIFELVRFREFDAFITAFLQQQRTSDVARVTMEVHNRWDLTTVNSVNVNIAFIRELSMIEGVVNVVFDLETNIWVTVVILSGSLLSQRHITMVFLQVVGLHISATVFALWDVDVATTTAGCELSGIESVVDVVDLKTTI
jgi:hypothetical protein